MENPSNGRTKAKTRTYLLYAVGEIALVMIGILLALQVNNWNENLRIEKIQDQVLFEVYKNLKSDLANTDSEINGNEDFLNNIDFLLNEGAGLPTDSLINKITQVHSVSIFKTEVFGYNKLTALENTEGIPDTLMRSLSKYYNEFSDGLNNTSYEGLSKYSLDMYRDYLIQHGFPLSTTFLGYPDNPDNPEVMKAIMKDIEFIGILRNTKYNRSIQQLGLEQAKDMIKNCLALLEAHFDNSQIAY